MASCHHLLRLWYKIAFLCALDLRLLMPKEDSNKEDKTSAFLFQPAKVAPCLSGLSKAGPLRVSAKIFRAALAVFSGKPCTIRHGTVWQARNKKSAHEPVSV